MMVALRKIDETIEGFSKVCLVFCVLSMLFLTLFGIVLRWFDTAFLWIDPLVRHLVFLSAFLGGTMATGKGSHIGIDVVSKILESKGMKDSILTLKRTTYIVSVIVVGWLAYAAFQFMKVELEFGKEAFLGIHSGVLVGIIPFGFFLIMFRFLYQFLMTWSEQESD